MMPHANLGKRIVKGVLKDYWDTRKHKSKVAEKEEKKEEKSINNLANLLFPK